MPISEPFPPPYARAPVMAAAFGFLILISSIALSSNGFHAFFSLGGLAIVVGGVIADAFMSFQASDVRKALGAVVAIFREPRTTQESLHDDMKQIVLWAHLIKGRGLREFESRTIAQEINDSFLRYGISMVVSEYTADEVHCMMKTAAEAAYERDCVPVDVLRSMASHGPAFGMIGTLLGMVTMLGNIGSNIESVESMLSVSFLSTLYGVLSARMIYIPAASRLQQEIDTQYARNNLIKEGMIMLVSRRSPSFIRDRLNAFLQPEHHDYMNQIPAHQESVIMSIGQRFATTAKSQDRKIPFGNSGAVKA